MIYDDSEEQSIINSSGAEEGFSDAKNNSNLNTQDVSENTVKPIYERPLLTREEYDKKQKNYKGADYWWKYVPEDELVKITSALVEEKNTRKYINEISESVKKDLETRGITNLIDTPLTRSFQSGLDSLAGGTAQLLGTAYDIASQNNKQSILTQWGAETSMMSNYMSNYVQREKGDTNKWDDVTGPGSFLTWGLHTASHMAPSFIPWVGWGGKAMGAAGRFAIGKIGFETAAASAAEISQGVRIAGTLSTTMHGVVGATTQETAALVAQQGWLSRTLGSISRGINPSKTITAVNLANEATKKISLLNRFAAQSPVAFNFGASAYGQIRPNLVNSGMDYDEATYKSFVSALPQAAFAYLPAFGQLNPSWTRFLGEAATMGGVNVLMNPVQAMVDNAIDLDEPKDGETYWDYLYRKTTENVLEPFAIGALFHLMSLPSRKFGKLARLDREMKNVEDVLTGDIVNDAPSGRGTGVEPPVTINGELSDTTRSTLPYFDNPNIIRDSEGNITAYRVNPSDYVSLDEVHASSILNGEQSPIDAVINDPTTGTTEQVQIIPSTKSFDETNGSTIQTTDGRTIRTENLTYKPKQENEAKFVEELDRLKAYKAELEARILPNDANEKANNVIREELKELDKAIKMVEQHLTLNNAMYQSNEAALKSIFGENFAPTVHGQQILFQYQQSLHDLLLLNKWMENSGLSKGDLSKQYELLQKNITTLENEINTKDTVNKQIYNKITELYSLLAESNPTKSAKVENIVNQIRELYKELKKDYEHPENLTEFTTVVNTLKQIAALDAFAADLAEAKKKYGGTSEDAVQTYEKPINGMEVGGITYNIDFGRKKKYDLGVKPEPEVNSQADGIPTAEEKAKQTDEANQKTQYEINEINSQIRSIKKYGLNKKTGKLTKKSTIQLDKLNKKINELNAKLKFKVEKLKQNNVYTEKEFETIGSMWNTEKGAEYSKNEQVMDSFSYRILANPIYSITLGADKPTIKLWKVKNGEYVLNIKLNKEKFADVVNKTILVNEKSYFVRKADNSGLRLIELTENTVVDSNIVRIETSINRLNYYNEQLQIYKKANGNVTDDVKERAEKITTKNKKERGSLASFEDYLKRQVESGLFSLKDAQKIYERLEFVEKDVFAEKFKKEKASDIEGKQQSKRTPKKLERLAPRNEAYETVYGKGNIYDKFTVLHKKLKKALWRVNKELKKTDKKGATENYFRKQLNDFIEKVKEIEKSKPKESAVKTNNSEIFKQINIEEFNNFINKIEELETLYDSDQYRALKETRYFLTEADELFGSIKTIKKNFKENNERYSEKTQDINTVISSKKAELIKRLDAFKAILEISQKDVKKIKSKKEVDEYFLKFRGNRKDATLLDIKQQNNRLPASLALDVINNNNAIGKNSYSFDYLSSTIVNINGQDVFLKTAFIQNSNTQKVRKIGEVFKHNGKFYRVRSIEKLPDLNLDTVTDKEAVAKVKFEKTGFDLYKIASNESIKKTYFDNDGKFKSNFELVTYELIEGKVNRVTDGIDKKKVLTDSGINNTGASQEALGLSRIMDHLDEMDSVLRDSFDRALIGESVNSLGGRVTEGSFNRFNRFNQNTIGTLPPRTANPPQATQQTRPSSMLTNPTAHTAGQAIAEQSAQQTAPEQIATQQPTSQQSAPQQPASQPIARGVEEAPRVEPRPIITNETQQVFNDGQPIDSPMPRAEEPSRPRTFERQQPLFDESTTASEKPKPPQVAAGGSGKPPDPPRRPVPPDEAETSGRSGKDSFTEESESRRRMLDDAEGSKEKFTLWEKFKNWWVSDDSPLEKLVTKLQTTLEKIGKKLPDEANAFLQFSLANQRKNAAISRSSARFNGEIMEPMKKAFNQYYKTRMSSMGKKEAVKQFMVDFDLFVELRSAEDLNIAFAEWAKQEPDKVASLTPPRSVEKAKAMLDALMKREPKLYEEFVNTHDKLTRMLNESLGELVTAGILEKSVYDALVKKYKNYAPMYAYEDALNSPTHLSKFNAYNERGGIGFAGLDIALKNRLGNSDLPRGEVLQHSLQMLRKRARAVAYAPAQRALYDFVKMGIDNKIFSKNFVSIIDPESGSTIDKLVESGMNYNDALLLSEGFKKNVIKRTYVDKNGNLVIKEISVPPPSDNVVPLQIFDEKGVSKKIYLAFDSKNEIAMHMAKLYNGSLDAGWMPTGVVGKAYFTALKNWNALNTGYNPFFAVKNFSADYFDMLTNISNTPLSGKRWAITKQIPGIVKTIGKYNLLMNKFKQSGNQAAFDAAINSDPILKSYHEYYMNGGSHNFVEDNNLVINEITDNLASKLRKGTGYQGGRQILDGIANLVNIEMNSLENSIRFASYQEGLKMGLSKDVATLLGKDITANFDRKGIIARKVNGLYSYTTANIAGQSRVFKSLTGKKGLVLLTGAILAGMAQQSMYDEMDTLDSEAIPDYVKQQYMVFPASDGGYIKIRIRGLGMLFQLGRNITKLSNGNTDSLSTASELLSSISFTGAGKSGMLQTLSPTFVKPMVAVGTNESWTGSKIRNEDPQGLTPKWMLGRAGSNPVADNVARALYEATGGKFDASPQDFEYLFKVYAGGAVTQSVQFAKSISEIGQEDVYRPTSNPFISPMPYGKSDIKNSSASFVYELDEKMRRTNQIIKKYLDAGDKETAQRLIDTARIPYNDSELTRLSRMRSSITEEKNRYVRQSRINGTINTPEFNQKIRDFNNKQNEIVAKQADAFRRKRVIK